MSNKVKPIPEGYHTVTPYLIIDGAVRALEFYSLVFGAKELTRLEQPDGRIGHAEIRIGDSTVMLADEFPDMGFRGPRTIGGSPVGIHLYVDEVDTVAAKAISNGAKMLRPVQDQFYGDRNCTIEDPFGHVWTLSTHKEDLSLDEINKRAAAHQQGQVISTV